MAARPSSRWSRSTWPATRCRTASPPRPPGLNYSGDAGGLNESTSDIFGTMVEFYANYATDPGDYYIGEKIAKDGTYLRRMDNPSLDGGSVNCWSTVPRTSTRTTPRVSATTSSTCSPRAPASKTIGGQPHSATTCNGTTLTGIGRDAAAAIWYRAMTTYWTSTTNYPQAANGHDQGRQGPLRRELHPVRRDRGRLEGRQRHPDRDLHHRWRRHGQQPACQPRLRVGRHLVDADAPV